MNGQEPQPQGNPYFNVSQSPHGVQQPPPLPEAERKRKGDDEDPSAPGQKVSVLLT